MRTLVCELFATRVGLNCLCVEMDACGCSLLLYYSEEPPSGTAEP